MNTGTAYRILDLPAGAPSDAIRQRYRLLASKSHPDRYLTPAEKAVATIRFQRVTEAYLFLKDHVAEGSATRSGESEIVPEPIPPRDSTSPFGDRLSSFDLLRPIVEDRPWLEGLVDIWLGVPLLIGTIVVFPLFLILTPLWRRLLHGSPRLENLVFSACFHWIPPIIALAFGRSVHATGMSDYIFKAWVLSGAILFLTLELIAQIIGFVRLRSLSRALAVPPRRVP